MRSFLDRVATTLRRRALVARGDRVAVAVSGGADSVALLFVLRAIARRAGLTLAGVIHVNHGLRGPEADRDEAFCRALAARLALPIEVASVDTREYGRARHLSTEAAARALREQWFVEAAARLGATVVATGHTADDQAETVLLRLLGGAGLRGVSGIRPRRGLVARPLIDCRRQDVRAYLASRGEAHCEDSSNATAEFPRNRVRQSLLPVIEQLAPGGVRALARFADLAAADEAWLHQAATVAARGIVLLTSGGVEVIRDALVALPPAIARRVIRLALERAGARRPTAAHVEAIWRLATSKRVWGRVDIGGLAVERRGATLVAGNAPAAPEGAYAHVLPIPGVVDVPEAGCTIAAHVCGTASVALASGRGNVATLDAASVRGPLVVRSRRSGDRFRPLGAPGRCTLKDLLIDRKVPRDARGRVPVVVDADGRIVWVVGMAIAEACRVTAPGAKVVVLTCGSTSFCEEGGARIRAVPPE